MKQEKYTYRAVNIDITAGITNYEIEINAERLQYLTGNTNLTIRLDSRSNDTFTLKSKQSVIAPFGRVFITAAAIAETITLFFGNPANVKIEIPADISKATVFNSITDVELMATATTQILPINLNRRLAIIRNLTGNPNTFRIGDSNAGAIRGVPLAPDYSISLETTEAIYGFNPGASADVAVIWTED